MTQETVLNLENYFSMPFIFNKANTEKPFSCPICPDRSYRFFMGIANHHIRNHFEFKGDVPK